MARKVKPRRRKLLIDAAKIKITVAPADSIGTGGGGLPAPDVCEALAESFWDWHYRKAAAERREDEAVSGE